MAIEVNHANAKSVWNTVRIDREGNMENVLVVETDLATSAADPAFDENAFGALADAIVDTMRATLSIDRAEISQIRKP
ncbi:hypothetical protein NKH41_03315 [Mesorhizobium sp. M1169]|uniref:hypothetical protein n=1 Tax=unclassified Mesorhizobium TaxID=325217 RepID=UPI003337E4CE